MMQSFAIESLIRSEASRLLSTMAAASNANIKDEPSKDREDANESQCSSSNDSNTFNDCGFGAETTSLLLPNDAYTKLKLGYPEELKVEALQHDHIAKMHGSTSHQHQSSPIGKYLVYY